MRVTLSPFMSKSRVATFDINKDALHDFCKIISAECSVGKVRAISALLTAIAHGLEMRYQAVIEDDKDYEKYEERVSYKIFEGGGHLVVSGLTKGNAKIAKRYAHKLKRTIPVKYESYREKDFFEKIESDDPLAVNRIGEIDPDDINDIAMWVYETLFEKLEKKKKEK